MPLRQIWNQSNWEYRELAWEQPFEYSIRYNQGTVTFEKVTLNKKFV
jgi:hypothetical protein